MIGTFIKHKLFELTIDRFFKTIESNFKTLPEIYTGVKFRSISMKLGSIHDVPVTTTYSNCEILDVYSGVYLNKPNTIFNFIDGVGNVIMGCNSNDIIFVK